jgi:hypothetical protein
MTTLEKPLKFDQVVHGYRDGHRQLAGSLVLDIEAADLMALASDLLTSRSLHANESYITGYPLKSEHKYVFARTWPAPEMSRPGCVWTHSLVIDYLTVSKIDDAGIILSLFERPTLATLSDYGCTLTLGRESHTDYFPTIPEDYADEVVQRIYGKRLPHREVTLASRGVEKDTYTAFAVWAQLPPRLRRATVLCTAASSSELPVESELSIRFSAEPIALISSSEQEGRRASSTFRGLRLLAKDLTRRSTTPLRQFLRRYSVDVNGPLPAMGGLAQVFLLLREAYRREEFQAVAAMIGRMFARSRDAHLLKQDLLFGRFFGQSMVSDRRANSFLGTLDAIDSGSLSMVLPDGEQANDVLGLEESPALLVSLLELHAAPRIGEFVDSCIRSTVGKIPLTVLSSLEVDNQQALSLATIRPDLLGEAGFWSGHVASRAMLVRNGPMDATSIACYFHVFRDNLDPADIEVLLERNTDVTVACVAALWKENATSDQDSRMLVRILGSHGDLLSHAIALAGWLPRAAWQDAGGLLASGSRVSVSGTIWVRIINRAQVTQLSRHESTLGALLFVTGLQSPPVSAHVLLSVSFDVLYTVAWNGKLTIQEQEILGAGLPGAETFWSWDYCRRLTQALLDVLLTSDSLETLLRMEVGSLAIKGIVEELDRRQDTLANLRNLNQKLDAVPGARDNWGKAINEAIERRTILRFFPW